MQPLNRNLFLGCAGHFATHYTAFILLFTLTQYYDFKHPFYVLILMSLMMFVFGLFFSFYKWLRAWNVNSSIMNLRIGPLFVLFIFHSFEWVFLVFSLKLKNALPILNYVTFSTATDNLFCLVLSKYILGRVINTGHMFSALVGLVGVICCEFLLFNGNNEIKKNSFSLDPTLTQDQTYAYIYCTLSRFCHAGACVVQKRALLKQAAFDRYKSFKLSSFRMLKVNDLNDEGEISKPIIQENAAIYKKAQFIIKERTLISNEKQTIENLHQDKQKKQQKNDQIISKEKALEKFIRNQEIAEMAKIDRNRGITKRYGKVLLEKNKANLNNKIHIEKVNDAEKVKVMNQIGGQNPTLNGDVVKIAKQIEDNDRRMTEKKIWAVKMSEEMQEIIRDYKFFQLHEHLFDGDDDIWLTKLDEIFDSTALDGELFGIEVPTHFMLMTVVGGLFSVPLFLIMHFISGDSMTSFMGILENRDNADFNFYDEMFSKKWQSVVILIFLCIMYTLKPIITTNFVLSLQSNLTYVGIELLSKIFYIFITMIAIEGTTKVSSMESLGLSLALLSQLMYYYFSDRFKDKISVKSACKSVKELFDYESIEEIEKVDRMLNEIEKSFSYKDAYRLLLDVASARDVRQLLYPSISTLHVQKFFDKDYYKRSLFWGQGYSRPSFEQMTYSHFQPRSPNQNSSEDNYVLVDGNLVYNIYTMKNAKNVWANMDNRMNNISDNKSKKVEHANRIDESVISEHGLLNTHQQLLEGPNYHESSESDENANHQLSEDEDEKSDYFMEKEDYDDFDPKTKRQKEQQKEQLKLEAQSKVIDNNGQFKEFINNYERNKHLLQQRSI